MVPHPNANVFVATPDDAATGALSASADGKHGATIYGICAESIAALQYAMLAEEYQSDSVDLTVLHGHKVVYTYNKLHGGWLFRFPQDFVRLLVQISNENRRLVAQKWSKVFENCGKPPNFEEVERMVGELVILAETALNEDKPMYWLQEGC